MHHLDLALSENARAEVNLRMLLRGLQQALAGVSAARDANTFLAQQLEGMRELLERSNVQERLLRQRVRFLEDALEGVRLDAARERASLLAEEDAFLAELLTDHERELSRLKETLVPPPPVAVERSAAERETVRPPGKALGALKLKSVWRVDPSAADSQKPSGEGATPRPDESE